MTTGSDSAGHRLAPLVLEASVLDPRSDVVEAMYQDLFTALQQAEWLGQLLARVAVGVLFVISGGGKLFVPQKRRQMRRTIREAGVPAARLNAGLVSFVELTGGLLLLLGLLTPLASLALAGVMVVALATVQIPGIEAKSVTGWLGELLYVPDAMYLVVLIWLFLAGPGPASFDHLILHP